MIKYPWLYYCPFLQLIYVGEYTKAMQKAWHLNHFCCWQCDSLLTDNKYIVINENPFCQKCYTNLIANVCRICRKPIEPECKDLYVKDRHYHGKCLVCVDCHVSLVSYMTLHWRLTLVGTRHRNHLRRHLNNIITALFYCFDDVSITFLTSY